MLSCYYFLGLETLLTLPQCLYISCLSVNLILTGVAKMPIVQYSSSSQEDLPTPKWLGLLLGWFDFVHGN